MSEFLLYVNFCTRGGGVVGGSSTMFVVSRCLDNCGDLVPVRINIKVGAEIMKVLWTLN